MSGFKRFYLFGMNAKFYMGIYFAAIVFLVGGITAIFGGDSLSLWTLLGIFAVSMIVGFTQEGFLGGESYDAGIFTRRTVVWLALSTLLVTAAAKWLDWFGGLPGWCVPLLGVFIAAGFVAMLLGQSWEQEKETRLLNEGLKRYQQEKHE